MTNFADKTYTLGIEMSNPGGREGDAAHAVALWRGEELAGSLPMAEGERGSDALMALIQRLCAEQDISPDALDRLIVSIGPGGYTALRISTTTAKVLALMLGARLVGVETARVAAQSIGANERPSLIALASKKDQAHGTVLGTEGSLERVGVIDAGRIEVLSVRSIVSDRHLPQSFAAAADRLGIAVRPIVLDARMLIAAAAGVEAVEPGVLRSVYAREPDAVTQWRARASQ